MLAEGSTAPRFELPALIDGSYRQVALEEFLGDDVVILAFVPGDFNPACDERSCDLDELDLFTMQKDVTVLGVSPDSVYSHRAFADTYDLNVPLLADTDHEVARQYDVEFVDDIGQHLVERAVAVVDHDGVVQYAWSTTDPERLPDVEAVKDAIAETGGDDTAFARYRIGHAHFTEGRRAFTAAMEEFGEYEWMLAQGDFQQAREEFASAGDHFETAARFVDDPHLATVYDGSVTKANSLWQAADWLAKSAREYASGDGAEGQALREDAERPLEVARGYRDPPDPDQWPPDVADLNRDGTRETGAAIRTDTETQERAALDVDIDAEVERTGASEPDAPAARDGSTTPSESEQPGRDSADEGAATETAESSDTDEDIDDEEIAAIHAEVEANNPVAEASAGDLSAEPTSIVDGPPAEREAPGSQDDAADGAETERERAGTDGEGDDDPTLDLADPSESTDGDDS